MLISGQLLELMLKGDKFCLLQGGAGGRAPEPIVWAWETMA